MKILIIRFSSIGDIVLTTPVIRCLKKQLGAEVHYLTKKGHYTMLSENPYVDRVHVLHSSVFKTIDNLKREKYDVIIDLHHNLRTLLIKAMVRAKSYSYNKLNFEKWLLVNFKVDRLPDTHIVDRYLETCLPLGVRNDGEGLDYFIPEKDVVDVSALPEGFQDGYVAWVIGSKHYTKKFPNEKVINVINSTSMPVVIIGGKDDKSESRSLFVGVAKRPHVYNAVGEYSVNQSASLVRQAKLVVTNDTGLMHIAAAFQKKIISIWGNTIPQFGMTPYYGAHAVVNRIIEIGDLPCRPCSKIGYDHCPKGHFKCMKGISEVSLIKEINALYEKA